MKAARAAQREGTCGDSHKPRYAKTSALRMSFSLGDPCGNRTHDCAVRGRRLSRLTKGPHSKALCAFECSEDVLVTLTRPGSLCDHGHLRLIPALMLLCNESAVGAFIAKRFWLFRNKHWAVGLLPLHLCFLAEGFSLEKRKGPAPTYFPRSSPTKYLRHNRA